MRINILLWQISGTYQRLMILRRSLRLLFIFTKFLVLFSLRALWANIPRFHKSHSKSSNHWEQVRVLIEDLGPTYIKFGQIMSIRPEIPAVIRDELRQLQENVPSFSYREAKQIIEKELRAPIDDIFSSFEKKPIAAASLAQVHKAVLKKEQVEVAVKVQRPNLDSVVEVDLKIMKILIRNLEKLSPGIKSLNISGILGVFDRGIRKEMDFEYEGSSLQKTARNFANRDTTLPDLGCIVIPSVYWRYTSRKVLTMAFIDAIPFYKAMAEARERGINVEQKMETLSRIYAEMIFEHGFFHADPHPGNLYMTESGDFVLFDFGMVDYVDDDLLQKLGDFMLAVLYYGDAQKTIDALVALHIGDKEDIKTSVILDEARVLFDKHRAIEEKEGKSVVKIVGIANLSDEIMRSAMRFGGIKLPDSICWAIKIIAYMEGLTREVSLRRFDPLMIFHPYLIRVRDRSSAKKTQQKATGAGTSKGTA